MFKDSQYFFVCLPGLFLYSRHDTNRLSVCYDGRIVYPTHFTHSNKLYISYADMTGEIMFARSHIIYIYIYIETKNKDCRHQLHSNVCRF